jgi:YD repeat-containing protein
MRWKYLTIQYSTSQCELTYAKSNSVGYMEVTENRRDKSGNAINGKSVYKYSFPGAFNNSCDFSSNCLPFHPDSCRKAIRNIVVSNQYTGCYPGFPPYTIEKIDNFPFLSNPEISFCKGLLLEDDKYDKMNNLVQKTTYDYCYGNQHPVLGIKSLFYMMETAVYNVYDCPPNCNTCGPECYIIYTVPCSLYDIRWGVDQILCGSVHLNKKTVQDYSSINPNLFVTTETNYQYNDYLQLSSSSTLNSDGSSLISKFLYPTDYARGNADPYSEGIFAMKSRNISNEVIETTRSDKTNNTEKVTSGEIKFFKTLDDSYRKIYLDKIDRIETNSALSNFSPSNINNTFNFDSHYKDYIKFDDYNFNSDLTLRQFHKVDDINTSCYWGYRNAYKVVVAQNVTYSDLSSAINTANSDIEGLLLSLGDMNTEGVRHQWQFFNTTLRSNPALAHSLVTTYTYKPLVGITSVTDPAGIATYYEYDSYGRLLYVKDTYFNILKKYDYHYAGQ